MTIDDYEKVYALWLNTPNMGLNDIDDSREGIHKYLKRNPSTCFIAEEGGTLYGVILCGHDGRRGFIYHMAVREDRQREGIGTALVNAALSALEKEGITKAALVVKNQNDKGNMFWEKRGFGTRPDLVYRNKAIAELKRLDT
jgi:ribosomal protein S18 acetylase RimI-like enzyme